MLRRTFFRGFLAYVTSSTMCPRYKANRFANEEICIHDGASVQRTASDRQNDSRMKRNATLDPTDASPFQEAFFRPPNLPWRFDLEYSLDNSSPPWDGQEHIFQPSHYRNLPSIYALSVAGKSRTLVTITYHSDRVASCGRVRERHFDFVFSQCVASFLRRRCWCRVTSQPQNDCCFRLTFDLSTFGNNGNSCACLGV